MKYSDEKLIAFLDERLPANEAHAIEAEIRADKELERRLMELDPFGETIRDSMLELPKQARLEKISTGLNLGSSASLKWPVAQISAIAAAFMIGIFSGQVFFINDADQSNDWRIEVARYQALYVTDTVANLDTDPELLDAQFDTASRAVDIELSPSDLRDLGDLTLGRAQILGFQDQPLVQIVFKTQEGIPIAFCMMKKNGTASNKGFEAMQLAGLASGSWETDTHRMIVIGGQDQSLISNISSELQSRFN